MAHHFMARPNVAWPLWVMNHLNVRTQSLYCMTKCGFRQYYGVKRPQPWACPTRNCHAAMGKLKGEFRKGAGSTSVQPQRPSAIRMTTNYQLRCRILRGASTNWRFVCCPSVATVSIKHSFSFPAMIYSGVLVYRALWLPSLMFCVLVQYPQHGTSPVVVDPLFHAGSMCVST